MVADKNFKAASRSKSSSTAVHNSLTEPAEELSPFTRSRSYDINSVHSTPHTNTGASDFDTGMY